MGNHRGGDGLETGDLNRWAHRGAYCAFTRRQPRVPLLNRILLVVVVAGVVLAGYSGSQGSMQAFAEIRPVPGRSLALVNLSRAKEAALARQITSLRRGISFYRDKAWQWQDQLEIPRTRSSFDEKRINSPKYLSWSAELWAGREAVARLQLFRLRTWYWQRLMSITPTRSAFHERRTKSVRYKRWLANEWEEREAKARLQAHNPPRLRQWMCIHEGEGAWNDPDGKYYGGLQMDLEFQRTYGSELLRQKGTADNWTPLEQIWVAERAYRSGRGFYPWPETARNCHLI